MLRTSFIKIALLALILTTTTSCREKVSKLYHLRLFEAKEQTSSEADASLNYRLFDAKAKDNEKLPLVVYLHPYGNGGDNNRSQIDYIIKHWARKKNQKNFPCYIIAPQCPATSEWANKGEMQTPYKHYTQDAFPETIEIKLLTQAINKTIAEHNIDTNRIYLMGHSMGATGCWNMLGRYPETFAAAIISAGVSDTSIAKRLTHIPVWVFSGKNDSIAPAQLNINMVNAINNTNGKAKITLFENEGHNIGHLSFNYDGVKTWLFEQSKTK